jgi:hypothetical protein
MKRNVIISDRAKEMLAKYITNLDEVIFSDDINDLLLEIDDVIIRTFDAKGNPSKEGIELQKLYDEIYANN